MNLRGLLNVRVFAGIALLVLIVVAAVPESSFAAKKVEYKVVVLKVTNTSMPTITAALNAEVERGYTLDEMSVIEPGLMYLVFKK